MALSSEIEAKSPEIETPGEISLPSVESALAPHEAPGLLGWLSRPDVALKWGVATLALGVAVLLLRPFAMPTVVRRQPPPLPDRPAARRPRHHPDTPLPAWTRSGHGVPVVQPSAPPREGNQPASAAQSEGAGTQHPIPNTQHPSLAPLPSRLRIVEPGGVVCILSDAGVALNGERVPSKWAREARRLFVPPPPESTPPARSGLRLVTPNPDDGASLGSPPLLRWATTPGTGKYRLTLQALTDPAARTWQPVRDLIEHEVDGTEYVLPTDLQWTPGRLYRWHVETAEGHQKAFGRFRVLSERQRDELIAARRSLGKSRLLRAAVYRAFGFYGAALDEATSLSATHPTDLALQRAVLNLEADVRQQRAHAAE